MPITCSNPSHGTHILVRGNLRDTVLKSVLQRVIAWAEEDAYKIDYQFGGGAPYVRIPPEVILNDHGPLTLKEGGEQVPLGVDRGVWVEPTIFDVDGLNPTTLIEYEQVWENFGPKGKPDWNHVALKWEYKGNSQEKTEPTGWIVRWRKKVKPGLCTYLWEIVDCPAWTRVLHFHGLDPQTEYEFSLQGVAQPGSTEVFTPAGEPITIKTPIKPFPVPEQAPRPVPVPPSEGGGESGPLGSGSGDRTPSGPNSPRGGGSTPAKKVTTTPSK